MTDNAITIKTHVKAPIDKVWDTFTKEEHIVKWNNASEDWHTPRAENNLTKGGTFTFRMEAKDGSFGFDFGGTYDDVQPNRLISYTMGDGRKVEVQFEQENDQIAVTETFEPESLNPLEMQRDGWLAILNNFKNYVERT